MFALIRVGGWSKIPRRGTVIFVHGLGGHPYKTWASKIPENFWPAWLVNDTPGLAAYTVQYPAAATRFSGASLSIYDRAKTILEELLVEEELSNLPLIFVCHSMGGLIVKQLLHEADRRAEDQQDEGCGRIVSQTKAIVFLATPHLGSAQASWMTRLSFFVWPSEATQDLGANDPSLRQLHQWYIQWPGSKQIRHLEFQETRDTFGFRIVAPAVPGLNTTPIPIDGNHISLCKPKTKQTPPYRRVRRTIREILDKDSEALAPTSEAAPSLETFRYLSRDRAFLRSRAASLATLSLLVLALATAIPPVRTSIAAIFGSGKQHCYPHDPITNLPNESWHQRDCRVGRITYVKWVDEAKYFGTDPDTNRLPNDRANRSLNLDRVDGNGNVLWTEKNLVRELDGKAYWSGPRGGWSEIGPHTVNGRHGALLRRVPINEPVTCLKAGEKNPCYAREGKVCLIETFFSDDLADRIFKKNNPLMCYRWTTFSCDGTYSWKIRGETEGDFNICVGAIVATAKD